MESSIVNNESSYYDINSNKRQKDPFKINRQKGSFFRCVISIISIIILIILLTKLIKKTFKLNSLTKTNENFIKEYNSIEIECLDYKNKTEYAEKYRNEIDKIDKEIKGNDANFKQLTKEYELDEIIISNLTKSIEQLKKDIISLNEELKKYDEEIKNLTEEKEKLQKEIN